ncbi:MAG: hypothetical protein ACMG55_06005 [Microcoleus sp.]
MNKTTKPKTTTIEKNVMTQIKSGKTHMRPRSYYLSLSVLGVIATSLLGFTAIYFISVSSVWFRIIAADGPAYGAKRNLNALLGIFPWWALVLGLISIAGIVYLVKKQGHMYKVRLIYLIPLVIVLFIALGFALSYSDLPGLMNGNHGASTSCGASDLNCNINGNMYGRGRLMK